MHRASRIGHSCSSQLRDDDGVRRCFFSNLHLFSCSISKCCRCVKGTRSHTHIHMDIYAYTFFVVVVLARPHTHSIDKTYTRIKITQSYSDVNHLIDYLVCLAFSLRSFAFELDFNSALARQFVYLSFSNMHTGSPGQRERERERDMDDYHSLFAHENQSSKDYILCNDSIAENECAYAGHGR